MVTNRLCRHAIQPAPPSPHVTIGAQVRLPMNHEFKADWPGVYLIVGLQLDGDGFLDITIAEQLNHGGDCSDGWSIDDLIII